MYTVHCTVYRVQLDTTCTHLTVSQSVMKNHFLSSKPVCKRERGTEKNATLRSDEIYDLCRLKNNYFGIVKSLKILTKSILKIQTHILDLDKLWMKWIQFEKWKTVKYAYICGLRCRPMFEIYVNSYYTRKLQSSDTSQLPGSLCSLRWFMHAFLLAHISHLNVWLPVEHCKIGLVRGGKIQTGHSRRARMESVSIWL